MSSKYVDTTAIMQVIGCVYNTPQLLDFTDKYTITEEDFPDEFHRIAFGAIYKIYELGAEKISLENISDFLSSRPKAEASFKQNKGEEWLLKVADAAIPTAFDYYYNRLKKMSLLRAYDNYGVDVSYIYDPDNILDTKKKQQQEDYLDNSTLDQIADRVDNVSELANILEDMGYETLEMRKALNNEGETASKVLKIVKLVVTVILVITLFFISYLLLEVYFLLILIVKIKKKEIKL